MEKNIYCQPPLVDETLAILKNNSKLELRQRGIEQREYLNKLVRDEWGEAYAASIKLIDPAKPNFDRFVIGKGLIGVADGASFSRMAQIAAQDVCEFFSACFSDELREYLAGFISPEDQIRFISEYSKDFLLKAHVLADREATTFSAGFAWQDKKGRFQLSLVHIGDSRIYVISPDKRIQKLTFDDSWTGQIEYALATVNQVAGLKNFPTIETELRERLKKTEVTQDLLNYLGDGSNHEGSLNYKHFPHLDERNFFTIEIMPESLIIACTDGIHDNLVQSEELKYGFEQNVLLRLWSESDNIAEFTRLLMHLVNTNIFDGIGKGPDDRTVQCRKFLPLGSLFQFQNLKP